jgi:hypothetical protein
MPPITGKLGTGSGITPATTFGVLGDADNGDGVVGLSKTKEGIFGEASLAGTNGVHGVAVNPIASGVFGEGRQGATGVSGISDTGDGVSGQSITRNGVVGFSKAAYGIGVRGQCDESGGVGVKGDAKKGDGVRGESVLGNGVVGASTGEGAGILGTSKDGPGVQGTSADAWAGSFEIQNQENSRPALAVLTKGLGPSGSFDIGNDKNHSPALEARTAGIGPAGRFDSGNGPAATFWTGQSDNTSPTVEIWNSGKGPTITVFSDSEISGLDILANKGQAARIIGFGNRSQDTALLSITDGNVSRFLHTDTLFVNALGRHIEWHAAARFLGNVFINDGYLWADSMWSGDKHFKIDHPLDPANKYLLHATVESPERMTVYDGIAMLDAQGEAWVQLPEWFEALNRDFRYQLTCIGGFASVYVAREIKDNQFQIAGGQSGLKVSWQVTGIRQDAYAKAHPTCVEVDKPDHEKGLYLSSAAHGQPEEKQIGAARLQTAERHVQEQREKLSRQQDKAAQHKA